MAKIKNPLTVVKGGGTPAPAIYYSEFNGAMYKEDMEIPANASYTGTFSILRGCPILKSVKVYATQFTNFSWYYLTDNHALKEIVLPYVVQTSGQAFALYAKTAQEPGTLQLGSIGNPVTSLAQNCMGSPYAAGENWTVTIYVNAETEAEIPEAVTQYSPWGANSLTHIVYRSSNTGEVIYELYYQGGGVWQ